MFNFFKKKKSIHLNGWEKELFENIFKALGSEYLQYQRQIEDGIIESVRFDEKRPNFIGLKLNVSLLNKYEKKNEQLYKIKGIEIFDKTSSQYKMMTVTIAYGLVLGYSVPDIFNFNPDVNKIKTDFAHKFYFENEDFDKIKFLFTNEELKLLNPSDVYEVILYEKSYYHLNDLEDGDFIGINKENNIYKITHDPFEITAIERNKLIEILEGKLDLN